MSDREWSAQYQPTPGEVRQGMKVTARAIYSDPWRVAAFAYSFVRGAGLALVAYVLSHIVTQMIGGDLNGSPWIFYGLLVVFWLSLLGLQRAIFLQQVSAYLATPIMKGQRIQLSALGIRLSNGRSESLTDWCDISDLVTGKGVLVAVQGNQGIVIPERLFAAQGGDTVGMREALNGWFCAAQTGRE